MPSLAALEAYNQYLTTYNKSVSSDKHDLHDSKKLKDVYGSIQKKNSQAPIFLNEPSKEEVLSALILKEEVYSYHQDIARLYANNPADPFMQKFPYSSNEDVASATLSSDRLDTAVPQRLNVEIDSFATPQTNIGSFLPSKDKVSLSKGNYSFDMNSKKIVFELQFSIYSDDTNEELQERLTRLINNSDLGVNAAVIKNSNTSALCIVSDSIGVPLKGDLHFDISDENTSHTAGVVEYLGLNKKITPPGNARITYDGIQAQSFDNTFKLYDRYELQIKPAQDLFAALPMNVEIGFYPDVDSLKKNIEGFVDGYNSLRGELTNTGSPNVLRQLNDLMKANTDALNEFGITRNDDNSLSFNIPTVWNEEEPNIADTSKLTSIGNKILKTLQEVSIDPMVHINRKIGIYQNPVKPANTNRPYLDYYSGLLLSKSL